MKEDKQCKIVCRIEKLSDKSAKGFKDRIENDYRVNMYVLVSYLPLQLPTRSWHLLVCFISLKFCSFCWLECYFFWFELFSSVCFNVPLAPAGFWTTFQWLWLERGARVLHTIVVSQLDSRPLMKLWVWCFNVFEMLVFSSVSNWYSSLLMGWIMMHQRTLWPFSQGNKEEKYFIFNHLSFIVLYHRDSETSTSRIVGFEVTPMRYVTCHVLWVWLSSRFEEGYFEFFSGHISEILEIWIIGRRFSYI